MSLQALIFDMHGALADTEEVCRQAFNAAFIEHGLRWAWTSRDYSTLRRLGSPDQRVNGYIDALSTPARERARLLRLASGILRAKKQYYDRLVRDGGAPLRPGVRRIVRDAHAAGMQLAIVSTAAIGTARALLRAEFGRRICDRIAIIAPGKAAPGTRPAANDYRAALSVLGLPASACVAFEDSVEGLRAAKALGLFTVVTPTRWTAHEDFASADLVLPSLGSALHPLGPESAARIGAPCLELACLVAMHEAAARQFPIVSLQEAA